MGRRRLVLLALAALLGSASAWLWVSPANAAAPVKDGWWTVTNSGLGFAPPAPPQVPSGGLYIENGFTGPTAISALTFQVDAGDAVGPITLKIAGHPVLTSPPVACPITPAGQSYQPAQGGSWSDRPAYDCSKVQVTGKVSSDNTTVTFDTGALLENGIVATVILAGGNADQVAFNAPGPDTLAVTPAGGPSGGAAAAPGGAPAGQASGAPAGVGTNTGATGEPAAAPISGLPSVPAVPASPTLPALAPGAPPAPTPASGGVTGGQASSPRSAIGPARLAHHPSGSGSSVRRDLAEAIGIAALLVALVAYSEGFGLLGGRIGGPARQRPASISPEA